jgi:hypothetical protein
MGTWKLAAERKRRKGEMGNVMWPNHKQWGTEGNDAMLIWSICAHHCIFRMTNDLGWHNGGQVVGVEAEKNVTSELMVMKVS